MPDSLDMPQFELETERLLLRELRMSDAAGIHELDSDPDVHKYLGRKVISSIAEAEATIDFIQGQYRESGIGRWAVIEKSSGEFVGWAGLKLIKEQTNKHIDYHDLGYRLLKRHWRKGYATEAAVASLNYGFEMLSLKEIFAMAHFENIASQNALTKAGLTYINDFIYMKEKHKWFEITRAHES